MHRPALDHRRWRRRMLVRKPVDGGMAAIDLREGKGLLAARDVVERSVILSSVRNPTRVRPRRKVGAHKIRRRIVVRLRSAGRGSIAHAGTKEDRDRAGAPQQYQRPYR